MKTRLSHELMALRAAKELQSGSVVNLGIGLPTMVSDLVPPARNVRFHSENGLLGYGPVPVIGQEDPEVINAGSQYVTLLPGAAVLDHADSFGMIRVGKVDVSILGAFQVSQYGDLANWIIGGQGKGSPGGALDLASGARRVIVLMEHTTKDNKPRLLRRCTYPLTAPGCVSLIVTDLGVFEVSRIGFIVKELAPGWTTEEVQQLTEATLISNPNPGEIDYSQPETISRSKVVSCSAADAIADIPDGAVVMMDGFGGTGGMPHLLLLALKEQGAKGLTIIGNTVGIAGVVGFGTPQGMHPIDHSILVENKQIKKAIATFPVSPRPSNLNAFELAYRSGEVELELVPQGTLAERIRAGGMGITAFYTPTGVGSLMAEKKETRWINGKEYVLEIALRADYALLRAYQADHLGNLIYRGTSRNFNPLMAAAADITIVEVDDIVESGALDPDAVVTPSVFVDRVVQRPRDFSPYQ